MLAEYQNKLGLVQELQVREARSQDAFATAQAKNTALGSRAQYLDQSAYASELQDIVNSLNQVEPKTTVYSAAQSLKQAVQNRLAEVAAQS